MKDHIYILRNLNEVNPEILTLFKLYISYLLKSDIDQSNIHILVAHSKELVNIAHNFLKDCLLYKVYYLKKKRENSFKRL